MSIRAAGRRSNALIGKNILASARLGLRLGRSCPSRCRHPRLTVSRQVGSKLIGGRRWWDRPTFLRRRTWLQCRGVNLRDNVIRRCLAHVDFRRRNWCRVSTWRSAGHAGTHKIDTLLGKNIGHYCSLSWSCSSSLIFMAGAEGLVLPISSLGSTLGCILPILGLRGCAASFWRRL